MPHFDKTYKNLLETILTEGILQDDPNRKGVQRLNIPSYTFRHKVEDGFPAITLRKINPMLAWAELCFFLSGSTDIRDLWRRGVNFWDKDWANYHKLDEHAVKTLKNAWKTGLTISGTWSDMGKIYPHQYRRFGENFDQIEFLVNELRDNPCSSRMVVSAWNPNDIPNACLPSCHFNFVVCGFKLTEGYGFEVHWQQRSTDVFLGIVINVCFYFLLGMLLQELTGHKFLGIQADLKNVHLYDNAITAAKELIQRDTNIEPCEVQLVGDLDYNNLNNDNLELKNYNHHGELRVEMLAYG